MDIKDYLESIKESYFNSTERVHSNTVEVILPDLQIDLRQIPSFDETDLTVEVRQLVEYLI